MTTTQNIRTGGEARIVALLALGTILAALVAGTAREADAAYPGSNGRVAFVSDRTAGAGVDNPTGDYEIFSMRPDSPAFEGAPDWRPLVN